MVTLIILWSVFIAFNVFAHIKKLFDYPKFWWIDLALHFVSGILLVMTLWLFTKNLLLIFTSAVCLSFAWEILEFLSDSIFDTNMQRWKDSYTRFKRGGLIDVMTDMIAAIVGIGLAVAFYGIIL